MKSSRATEFLAFGLSYLASLGIEDVLAFKFDTNALNHCQKFAPRLRLTISNKDYNSRWKTIIHKEQFENIDLELIIDSEHIASFQPRW